MALWGPIKANNLTLGYWEAVRQLAEGADGDQPEEVSTYAVMVELTAGNDAGFSWFGTVEHRYADGPVVLAAKVLTAATESTQQKS